MSNMKKKIAIGVVLLGLVAYVVRHDPTFRYVFFDEGEPNGDVKVWHEHRPQGGRLLISFDNCAVGDRSNCQSTSFRTVDTSSGRIIGSRKFSLYEAAIGHSTRLLWSFDNSRSLRGYDFDTLKLRYEFQKGLSVAEQPDFALSSDGAALLFGDGTGRKVKVDGSTGAILPASEGDSPVQPLQSAGDEGDDCFDSARIAWKDSLLTFRDHQLILDDKVSEPLGRFFEGAVVVGRKAGRGTNLQSVAAGPGDSIFIVHRESLVAGSNVQISRVLLPSGGKVWTRTLQGESKRRAAFLEGNAIIVVNEDVAERAVASSFRVVDGVALWRSKL